MDLATASPASDTPAASRGQRWGRLGALAGGLFVTGYVAMVDPQEGGAYPICPSRVLLGIDCPFCGGLRGTHDILHGHVGEALDHNLLLPIYLGVIAVMAGLYLLPIIGRPARRLHVPRWVVQASIAAVVAFMVVRNLPIDSLRFLRSGA
jgi:Protein of unknown function (DUF2752)